MIIDSTYFDGPLILPSVTTVAVRAAVELAIAEYEPRGLRELMWLSLYAAYIAGIGGAGSGSGFSSGFSSGFGSGNIEDRWLWIRDGHSYTLNGVAYEWEGLAPFLARYVYCKYRLDNFTHSTTGGEESGNAPNVRTTTPASKIRKEWAVMQQMAEGFEHMVYNLRDENNNRVYPEFNGRADNSEVYNSLGYF